MSRSRAALLSAVPTLALNAAWANRPGTPTSVPGVKVISADERKTLAVGKRAKVNFCSDGPTGWKSHKAGVLDSKAGYQNVMYVREGFAGWEARRMPIER